MYGIHKVYKLASCKEAEFEVGARRTALRVIEFGKMFFCVTGLAFDTPVSSEAHD